MTDLLTKEEREKLTETRLWLERLLEHRPGDAMKRSVAEGYFKDLINIIDNLSKRGVKKYSEEELRTFAKKSGISYQYFSAYFEGVTDFARFLGALEEK